MAFPGEMKDASMPDTFPAQATDTCPHTELFIRIHTNAQINV